MRNIRLTLRKTLIAAYAVDIFLFLYYYKGDAGTDFRHFTLTLQKERGGHAEKVHKSGRI
ncbi:MAG: hypothetical protein AB1632_13500 [Nitrospirota bacterium]